MKKILVVSHVPIPPIISGSCKCINSYCLLLNSLGYEVHYLYSGYIKRIDESKSIKFWNGNYHCYKYSFILRLINLIKRITTKNFKGKYYPIDYFYPSYGLSSFVDNLQKKYNFDAIIVNYPWMTKLLKHTNIPLKLYFTHDKFTDKSEIIKANCYSLSSSQEKEVLERADIILSIQESESEYFRTLVPDKKVLTVFTPFEFHSLPFTHTKNVLFFSGNSELNLNGIERFINDVWSLVIDKESNAKLIIGGGICKSLSLYKNNPTIKLVGYVDDETKFYSRGDVVINPVYQGTGLKIKTLESLSYGKITIVDPHSSEGLYKNEKAPIIVAKDKHAYADAILSSINNEHLFKKMQPVIRDYLLEMNSYIVNQYKSIKF